MEHILDWGIGVILWLQYFSTPALDSFFRAMTFLGDEQFILLALPILYWLIDRAMGLRAGVLLAFSAYINSLTKVLVGQPRPFTYDARVQQLTAASSEGFPSGHTQLTVTLWGYLALRFRRAWLWTLAALLLVLVPLSRVYLGVHFPTDLLGGYSIGALMLLLFLWLEPRLSAWLSGLRLWQPLAVLALAPGLLILLLPDKNGVANAGSLLGIGGGVLLERRWIRFDVAGSATQKLLRFVLGMAGTTAIYFGLRLAFAALEPEMLFRFIRYGLASLWVVAGAPWTFIKTGLAAREPAA